MLTGPAPILRGTPSVPVPPSHWGLDGVGRRNTFLKSSNQNDRWSDFLNICSNAAKMVLTAFSFPLLLHVLGF